MPAAARRLVVPGRSRLGFTLSAAYDRLEDDEIHTIWHASETAAPARTLPVLLPADGRRHGRRRRRRLAEETLGVCREDEFIWFDPASSTSSRSTETRLPSADELQKIEQIRQTSTTTSTTPWPTSERRRPRQLASHVVAATRPRKAARPRGVPARARRSRRAAARRLSCRAELGPACPTFRSPGCSAGASASRYRAARIGRLLSLHPLSASHGHGGRRLGAARARIASHHRAARSSSARTVPERVSPRTSARAAVGALWSRHPEDPDLISVRIGAFYTDPGSGLRPVSSWTTRRPGSRSRTTAFRGTRAAPGLTQRRPAAPKNLSCRCKR